MFEYDVPVGALWRRGHKPMKAQGLEYIENLGDYVKHNHGRIFTETTAEKLSCSIFVFAPKPPVANTTP
jgi:hypothetical protein